MQKSKFTRNRSNSCNNTSLSDLQIDPKIRSHSLSLPTSNASSIRNESQKPKNTESRIMLQSIRDRGINS